MYQLYLGDCIEQMRKLPDNSVDSIVTDPPYELGFMGKSWDSTGIAYSVKMWDECLRVLKHGGYLLSFGGSRTYHRMAVAIEDAGFEIRDQIMWVYGSGFPKSLDVSKAIDKAVGVQPIDLGESPNWRESKRNREVNGQMEVRGENAGRITAPASDAAKQWDGWGTALKPAHEPIVMARKPLAESTVAKNVLKYGTGALNIDGSRVGDEVRTYGGMSANQPEVGTFRDDNWVPKDIEVTVTGRWPANFIHDGSDEVVELFPEAKGWSSQKNSAGTNVFGGNSLLSSKTTFPEFREGYNDSGSAARFFYCAKTSKKDRNEGLDDFEEKQATGGGGGVGDYLDDVNSASGKFGSEKAPSKNNHPTVKPTELMRYLVRMVTPPNGTVLDPFTGSGSTGKASVLEGFNFIGCELDPDYIAIAEARIKHGLESKESTLF